MQATNTKTQRTLNLLLGVAIAFLLLASVGQAANYTWNSTSSSNWNDGSATGWNTGGAYPNAQGDTATFSQNLGANPTITLNVADARVGTLTLTDTAAGNGWVLAGANPLTFDVATGAATLNATGSSVRPYNLNPHTISAPIAASVPLTVNLGANGGLVLSGNNASLTGGITVNGSGSSQAYVRFGSAASLGASGNTITVSPGAQAVIAFSGLTQADLNRFAASSGLLSFWESYHANGPSWGTPQSPAPNLNLTGFNEYFRIGAGSFHIFGDSTTVSGTFTPPSNTFRFGGGGGRLTVDSLLANGAATRAVEISGAEIQYGTVSLVALTKANTYTGATEVRNGVLRLAGTSGSALNTSAFNVRPGAFLQLDAGLAVFGWGNETGAVVGNNNNRVGDTTAVNLYGATLNFFGNPDTGTTETIGALNAQAGLAVLDARWKTGNVTYDTGGNVFMDRGGAGTGAAVLTAQSLSLNNGAQLWLRGVNVGVAGASATRVMFTTAPTTVGGGGGAGSTTISIIPGVFKTVGLSVGPTLGQNWVTYDGTVGLRELSSGAGEYSTLSVGENSDNNALYSLTGATPTLNISSATTVNSLKVQNNSSSGAATISGTGPLTIKSGNLLFEHTGGNQNSTTLSVPLDFNGKAGQIFWVPTLFNSYNLNSVMSNTGSNGVSFSAFNTDSAGQLLPYVSAVSIGGASTYTGPTTINAGYWYTAVASNRLPSGTDILVQSGTTLAIGNGFTETVASLKGNGTLALGNASSKLILGTGAGGGGAVTVNTSGTLAPGNGPGMLTLSTANLVVNNGGTFAIELNGLRSGTDYDRLVVNGSVTLNGGALNVTLGFMPQLGDTFFILDNDLIDGITGSFTGLPEGTKVMALFGATPVGLRVYYGADLATGALTGGNDIALLRIPEPMSGLLLALGAGVACLRRRR